MIKLPISKYCLLSIYLSAIVCFLDFSFRNLNIASAETEQATQQISHPLVVDGDNVEYAADAKEIVAQGNVVITYEDMRMTCDKVVLDTQTKDAEATGDVRIQDPRGILEAEKIIYNFQNKTGTIIEAKLRSTPYYFTGDEAQRKGEDKYVIKNGYFSSCNYDHPHFRIRSKRIIVTPGDKIVAKSNTFYWENLPFFYLPQYNHSLKDPFMKVQFQFGKTSDWGIYTLSTWRHDLNDNLRLRLYLDWRERWGLAQGFGLNYDTKIAGTGDFKFYNSHERRTNADQRTHQEFQRYFLRLRHLWDIDPSTQLTAQYYRIEDARKGWYSDADFLKDYFYREYEKDTQPKSYVLINRALPNSHISMLMQKRTNRTYSETEKLPEITYDLPTYGIAGTPLQLENKTIFSSLNRKYATPSPLDDDVVRLDSFSELTLPTRFMFVKLSPYVGLRETYYSKNIDGDTISPRTVFNTGIDMSTRIYRFFNVKTNFLGMKINKLRHIIIPTIKYAYTHEPTVSSSRLQQFDSIDSLDGDNRFILELENKLQTKRKDTVTDLAIFRVSSDYIMYSKTANISKGQNRFTDFLFDLELMPLSWVRIETDATYNHRQDYFSSVNVDSWFDIGKERSIGLGHRYTRKPEGGSPESKEMTGQIIWRINPKWKFRFYGRYQFTRTGDYRAGLREQEYTIYRDLHCGTLEINFNRKKKVAGKTDSSIWCMFNLKIFKESEFDYVQSYHPPKVLEY